MEDNMEKMERTISSFQYHIYTTMYCSLACQHCFIDSDIRADPTHMSVEEFKRVVDIYAEHFEKSDADKAEVTIIGGEPTTVKASFYLEVMPYLKEKFEATGKFFYSSIVTNFLHTKNLAKFDHMFDSIVTSYEPLRFTDYNAKNNNGKKGDIWLRNVQQWMADGKEVSVSLTTTKDVVEGGMELLDYLHEMGITNFQFNQSVPEGDFLKGLISDEDYAKHLKERKDELLEPVRNRKIFTIHEEKENSVFATFDEESDYMIEMTKWYIKKRQDGHNINVYPIESFVAGLADKVVIDDIACCVNKGLNTRVDGKTTGCASEIGSKEMLSYGNIYEEDLENIVNSDVRNSYVRATKRVKRECVRCEYFKNCSGACMLRAKLWDTSNPDAECHGLRRYLKFLEGNIELIQEVSRNVC